MLILCSLGLTRSASAELPTGYLVWSKGNLEDSSSRKIYRMTLPAKSDVVALTSGEDIGAQISPDGKWVAYAKAKLEGGTDYHTFHLWRVFIVSIEGLSGGAEEIEIDPEGYWPSWGNDGALYYSKADDKHTRIIKVTLDHKGARLSSAEVFSTRQAFPSIPEVNECFMAPDGTWFAGRTRGNPEVVGVGAYSLDPPQWNLMGKVGSTGCMPYVAPGGRWGFHAGNSTGIRWGHAPHIQDRKENQQLIPPLAEGYRCYHPGISTDEKWVMTGQSKDSDQNAGAWNIHIYPLDPDAMTVGQGQELAVGGFNGWPHLWVEGAPPAPLPADSGALVQAPDGGPAPDGPVPPSAGGDLGLRPSAALQGGCVLTGTPRAGERGGGGPPALWPMLLLILLCGRGRGDPYFSR